MSSDPHLPDPATTDVPALPAPIVSPTGIIHVLGYTPTEGEQDVPITVRIHFHPDLADAMFVRLVLANKAVPTKVKQLPSVTYGCWQLHAAAPPFDRLQSPTTKILISVQALNQDNVVLDTVTFGEFSYWGLDGPTAADRRTTAASIARLPKLLIPDQTTIRRRSDPLSTTSANGSERSPFPKSPTRKTTRLHRRLKSQSLCRTKQSTVLADQEELHAQTPVLDLVTPLSSVCTGWATSEIAAGRRLVRFSKVQDGRRLIVSCEPILQEDYCETDSVISCIYREDADSCFVTSVDVIYLLERLTNGEFPVEEKNRIRRNLEGLRPTTVSKHKPGFGEFFQRIMEFPDPKPRNIEKDLKVFDWNLLGQALEKILSKYTIYTTTQSDSAESSPVETPLTTRSPELYALQLSYPTSETADARPFLDQQMVSHNLPLLDDLDVYSLVKGDLDNPFPSPVDSVGTTSSSSSAHGDFALITGDRPTDPVCPQVDTLPWPSNDGFKRDPSLEQYSLLSSYEIHDAVSPGTFPEETTLGFNIYDDFSFHGISDDTLATLAEQYI